MPYAFYLSGKRTDISVLNQRNSLSIWQIFCYLSEKYRVSTRNFSVSTEVSVIVLGTYKICLSIWLNVSVATPLFLTPYHNLFLYSSIYSMLYSIMHFNHGYIIYSTHDILHLHVSVALWKCFFVTILLHIWFAKWINIIVFYSSLCPRRDNFHISFPGYILSASPLH